MTKISRILTKNSRILMKNSRILSKNSRNFAKNSIIRQLWVGVSCRKMAKNQAWLRIQNFLRNIPDPNSGSEGGFELSVLECQNVLGWRVLFTCRARLCLSLGLVQHSQVCCAPNWEPKKSSFLTTCGNLTRSTTVTKPSKSTASLTTRSVPLAWPGESSRLVVSCDLNYKISWTLS